MLSRYQFGVLAVLSFLALYPVPGVAQSSGSTLLVVEMAVLPEIRLTFETAIGGCPLGNSGTNNVGLNLGYGNFLGGTGGTYTGCGIFVKFGGGNYQVRAPFDLVVNKYNSSSTSYSLTAWLGAPPPPNVDNIMNPTGSFAGAFLSTVPNKYETNNAYGRRTEVFSIQINRWETTPTITETIYFLATAN